MAAVHVPNAAAPKAVAPVVAGVPRLTPLKPLPPAAQGQTRVVILVGDSMMAVGLSDVLLRQTAADQNLRVVKAFRSGTGLARPDGLRQRCVGEGLPAADDGFSESADAKWRARNLGGPAADEGRRV
jgi:hypothetical protein